MSEHFHERRVSDRRMVEESYNNAEVRELVREGDLEVMKALGEKVDEMGGRVGGVESRLGTVETRLGGVEAEVKTAVELSQRAVDQGDEILAAVKKLQEDTADGIVVTEAVTRWRKTAQDFGLDKVGKWLVTGFGMYEAQRLVGWLFGPQIKEWLLHKFGG